MYFIHYFYVSVTDDAPKCPGAKSPASSWPCAELSRRRIGGAELSHSGAWISVRGTGLCSYRVRGVDGSCAKHLTVESYTVVVLLTFIIIISIPSPRHSFIPDLNLPFLQILPTVAFLSSRLYGFPRLFIVTSEHAGLYFLVFLFYTFSCRFRAVD